MVPEPVERKLAAILSADVVGYSRLMAEDEAATIRTLTDKNAPSRPTARDCRCDSALSAPVPFTPCPNRPRVSLLPRAARLRGRRSGGRSLRAGLRSRKNLPRLPEAELVIACDRGRSERGGSMLPSYVTPRTASFFLSQRNTAIHVEPGDLAQASGRAAVRDAARGRNHQVVAEPEGLAPCRSRRS